MNGALNKIQCIHKIKNNYCCDTAVDHWFCARQSVTLPHLQQPQPTMNCSLFPSDNRLLKKKQVKVKANISFMQKLKTSLLLQDRFSFEIPIRVPVTAKIAYTGGNPHRLSDQLWVIVTLPNVSWGPRLISA